MAQPAPVVGMAQQHRDELTALNPQEPQEYLLLGEVIADQATTEADRRLAAQLLCLAFEAARGKPAQRSVAGAAAMALTDLDGTEKTKRWLTAMARTVDPSRAEPQWLAKPAPASPDSSQYQIATVLGMVRSGDGAQARTLLAKREVHESLAAMDRLLSSSGVAGGLSGLEREAAKWACPTCGNKRVVRKQGVTPPEYRACTNCGGAPGPALSNEDLIGQLRLESLLLQGLQRSWAAQAATDRGEPLIDPDPAALCAAFQVDPAKFYWREGQWCATPDCSTPAPPPPLKAPEPKKPTVTPAPKDTAAQ